MSGVHCTKPAGPDKVTPMTPDQIDLLKKARDSAWPLGRIASYDEFAKWIFTSAAAVGTLGAAFSNTAFKTLSTAGTFLFAGSLLATSVALATAVLSRNVDFSVNTNWQTLELLITAESVMEQKRRLIRTAGAFFTLALLLAGLSPVSSARQTRPTRSLQLAMTKDGFHVTYVGVGNKGKEAEIRVIAEQGQSQMLLGMQRTAISDDRQIKFDLITPTLQAGPDSVRVQFLCDVITGNVQELVIALKHSEMKKDGAFGFVCT